MAFTFSASCHLFITALSFNVETFLGANSSSPLATIVCRKLPGINYTVVPYLKLHYQCGDK